MANFPFTVGDSLRIGSATISASGNAVVLPTGTQVGNQNVATTVEVSTGGGPKITNLQVTSNVYVVLDDTAVDLTGGFIKITGTNFVSGCMVYVASTPANSTTFVSTTEVRAQLPATAAGTYPVYLVNPDGGTAIRVPGVTFSASPAWQTASSLGEQYDGVVLTLPVVATDATVYTLTSGSLPPGLSLNSNTGVISGTVSGVANDTVYSFTITATDAQLQDSPRTFTVTITVSDPYFKLTTLLLSGSAVSANTVIRDSSTNNFNLTVAGDARASNFTPYGTGWSVYFDGTGDYLSFSSNTALTAGTSNFTCEFWFYNSHTTWSRSMDFLDAETNGLAIYTNGSGVLAATKQNVAGVAKTLGTLTTTNAPLNQWNHFAIVRSSGSIVCYINGTPLSSSVADSNDYGSFTRIGGTGDGYIIGNLSNFRFVKGTAVYTANFTPATTNLTSVANTSLLTCNANRFLDGSTNNFTITPNGDARVVSFNPFNITNTGVNGSAYFDGTGDYIDLASNAYWNFGDGTDFTIELWAYTNNLATQHIIWSNAGTNSSGYNSAYINTNGTIGIGKAGVNEIISATSTWVSAQWNHLAFVRNGSNLTIFYNGVSVASTASASTYLNNATAALSIGRNYQTSVAYFTGYISNYRVVKGTAVYTASFTPPTQTLTAVTNTQLLTLQYDQPHNNHTFLDSSSNQFLITRSGNATQGTFSPFSPTGWSAYFDGTGDVLTIPDSAISQLGSSDFTVECWINTSKTTGGSILTKGVDENVTWGNFFFSLTSSNYLFFEIDPTPSTSADRFSLTDTVAISSGQWHHVAVTRSGNDWKLFRNGTIAASGTSSASFSDDTYAWVVGGSRVSGSTTASWVGYISNLRLIKGSAVYTTAFTPPTAPLSAIANTAFLICHTNRFIDASTNNFAITVTGDSKVVAFSPFPTTAVYNPAVHGGSVYVDGSGDYLTPQAAAIPTGAGTAFTIEAWIYPISVASVARLIGIGTNGSYLDWYVDVNATLVFDIKGTTAVTSSASNAIKLNQWQHVVLTRTTGNLYTLYINGQIVGTPTVNNTSLLSSSSYYIFGGGPQYGSQFRITPALVYTGNFTPPTLGLLASSSSASAASYPSTANVNTTFGSCSFLLNFTDAAILDSTGRQVLETSADAKSSSVITKFTGGSMSFDGTGDYLQSSDSLSELVFLHNGTPWTVDGWFYTGSTSDQYILSTDAASATIGMTIGLNNYTTRDITAVIYRGVSGSWVTAISSTNSWNLNTWTHFAVTFDSSKNLTVYINGVQVATASGSSFAFSTANPSYPLVVGRYQAPTPGGYFNGYISDLRITRGYARYTGNFTAPTAPARLK